MVTVDSDCLATNTHLRADYRCSKTQAGGDADSSVVHLVADTGQWQSFKPVTGAGRTSSQYTSADDMIHGRVEQHVGLCLATRIVPGSLSY